MAPVRKVGTHEAVIDMGGHGEALARQILHNGGTDTHLLGVFLAQSDQSSGIDDLIGERGCSGWTISSLPPWDATSLRSAQWFESLGTIRQRASLHEFPADRLPAAGAASVIRQPGPNTIRRPLTGWGRVVKRAEDLVVGTGLLLSCH